MAQTNSRTSKRDTFPVYQPQTILYARWAEDGLWYKAKVTDLLPETQSYLVVFVDYGNTQQCTLADLAPLDMMTTRAAPPSLESQDPAVLEAQRRARIEERRAQLKQEEEARKQALEEKRRAVAEKKAKLEALDREEQMRKMEEQRARLQGGGGGVTPVKPVTQSVGTPVNVGTPNNNNNNTATNTNAGTPASSLKAQAASTPAALDGGSEKKKLAARMTLSVVGGSGGKLGMMKGVTLKELKEVAKQSPVAAAATPKTPAATLDGGSVLSGEAKANRVLDFGAGDTPTKKTVVAEVTKGTTSSSTPSVAGGTAPPAPVGVFSEDEEEEESSSMTPMKSGGGSGGGSVVKTGGSGLKKPPPVVVEDSDGETPEAFNPSQSPSPGGTTATSPMTTTTQILGMLEDSLEDDMDELERLRQESDAMDATINLFKQLQQETYKLESTAASYAADLGDLEAEARQLLGE